MQETEESIHEELKEDRVEIACIGPAGENLVKFAAIMIGHNSAGRGGLGAVMGAKNLKAVVVRDTGLSRWRDQMHLGILLYELFNTVGIRGTQGSFYLRDGRSGAYAQ